MKEEMPAKPPKTTVPSTESFGARTPIARTELVWPEKYDERGALVEQPRVTLPFQVIEVMQEGRACRETLVQPSLPLFGAKPKRIADDGWRNKLIWGENLYVLSSLINEGFAGSVDLIYIDPPFATGSNFSFSVPIGGDDLECSYTPNTIETVAYRDTWKDGVAGYLRWFVARLRLARDLLSSNGSILIHCDSRLSHYIGLLCDELFGVGDRGEISDKPGFRNEIIWTYGLGGSSPKCYPKKHDTILWYSKGSSWYFDPPMVPATSQRMKGQDKKCLDTWDIASINNMAAERTGYPTQKPEALLERIVLAHTKAEPQSLVLDFFSGSGTTLKVAEKHGRRWIGCDLSRFAISTTRKVLLDLRVRDEETGQERGARPFEILNLGRYERKYWQGITFGDEPRGDVEAALAAYVKFVLELYKAERIQGTHIHGKKGGALVHVGAVDAPVTIAQIEDAVAETEQRGLRELHVLAWEWEMGLFDPLTKLAKAQHGVDVRLLSIPREVMDKRAVEAGDVQFFDLAYLEIEATAENPDPEASRCVKVRLRDFVIASTDLIPEELRGKIRKWSDYIDYWAVDWDFRNDTFMSQWQSYRTRQNRNLDLETPVHTYPSAGRYQVLVKVIDIFGNDTSHLVHWEAK